MTTRSVTLRDGSVLRIRPYRPEDHDDVCRIFSSGMLGLGRDGASHVLQNSRPMKVLSFALPAASLLVTRKRCGLLGKAVATLGAAAVVPCLTFALLRRALKRYVRHSIEGPDLSDIETFYSAGGAGHGSAFWVAEIIDPELATPTSSVPLTVAAAPLPPQSSRGASAAGAQLQATAESPSSDGPSQPPVSANGPLTAVSPAASEPDTPLPAATPKPPTDPAIVTVDAVPSSGSCGANDATDSSCSSIAPTDSVGGEERQVRALVAGLVAAAVARIEAAASAGSATPASPRPTSAVSSLTGLSKDASRAKQAPGLDSLGAEEPAQPGTPKESRPTPPAAAAAVLKRPRIGSFAEPAVSGAAGAAAAAAAAAAAPSATTAAAAISRRPTIIGHVALERKSWKLAELRRMSVLARYAGQGVGGRLLETLVQHARDVGFRELVLHTSGMQPAARRLYERGGWSVSKVSRMQGMDVYTYTLDLTKKRS